MDCRFKPLGCPFTSVDVAELATHEADESRHLPILTFSSVSQLLAEHRHLKHQLVSGSSLSSTSLSSSPSSSPHKPETNSTHSVPLVSDGRTWVSIISTTVYADQSDPVTFPTHLVDEKSDCVLGNTYRPLKYPSLVVENGVHNSIVVVRVRTNRWKHLQLGWMNHHGTYLRRFVPGTRVHVTQPADSDEDLLFEQVDVQILSHESNENEQVYLANILFKVRDMKGDNRFEGHYRDLRVVAFCLDTHPTPVIRAYDVGVVIRTSPNASYLSAKRVPSTEVELGWNQPPVVPPMMGVRPTMRIDFKEESSFSPVKRKKLFSSHKNDS